MGPASGSKSRAGRPRAGFSNTQAPVVGSASSGSAHCIPPVSRERRELAREAREQVRDGIDPIELKRQKRLQAPAMVSLAVGQALHYQAQPCLSYYAACVLGLTVHGFRSTFRDWAAELTNFPNHVVEMALAHAIGVKVEAAYRRGDLFDKRKQLMAAWARYCQQKPIAHHPALPYDEAPQFMAELRARDGISARALEITILTALRTGEVINAQWNEIDLVGKMWTVPAARMKMNKEHRIPLSDRVIDILSTLPREGSAHSLELVGCGQELGQMPFPARWILA